MFKFTKILKIWYNTKFDEISDKIKNDLNFRIEL